jgi:hypothetical protein
MNEDINKKLLKIIQTSIRQGDFKKPMDLQNLLDVEEYLKKEVKKEEEKQKVERRIIDVSQFKPLTLNELTDILGMTIKRDGQNKIVTFLCELSAFTENSQFNISFNAPSSTGKSYIPTEIAKLFPQEDVLEIGYCSPSAFYHEQGEYDKETNTIKVDLSRKIIIFLDQPNNDLLSRLRSLLSHDKKEIQSKITDKNQKGGNRTKTVVIRGFPSVIFCSAGLRIDEQEGTRFILLSPDSNQEKIREAIKSKIRKETNNSAYKLWLNEDPRRLLIKERIEAIRNEEIDDVRIPDKESIERLFFEDKKFLKPRHQRDIGRFIALIKAIALLNLWFRKRIDKKILIANNDDIADAFAIWGVISESQEYNLPPYILNMYKEVIIPAWEEKNIVLEPKIGVTRQEIIKKHVDVYGRMIDDWRMRQQIIPMLEAAGLIVQERDQVDRRKMLISPVIFFNKNYSEKQGGVED